MTKSDELDDSMRVLSTGTCEILSGSSKLTYHIGSMPDGEIYLRIHNNTGGGFFSPRASTARSACSRTARRPSSSRSAAW